MAIRSTGVDAVIKDQLDADRLSIEEILDEGAMCIYGPLLYGLDDRVRAAVEALDKKRERLAIILNTLGGIVEVVECIVDTVRHFYDEVTFIIPDRAMSGDHIMMVCPSTDLCAAGLPARPGAE